MRKIIYEGFQIGKEIQEPIHVNPSKVRRRKNIMTDTERITGNGHTS